MVNVQHMMIYGYINAVALAPIQGVRSAGGKALYNGFGLQNMSFRDVTCWH